MAKIDTRIEKALAAYKKKYANTKTTAGGFYMTDYHDIIRLSRDKKGNLDPYNPIFNALEAGFIIGYRKAQRDARKKN